jgi:mitochondrial import inner membrane translocase subunit TIM44
MKQSTSSTAASNEAKPLLEETYRYGGITPKEFRNKIKAQRLGHMTEKEGENVETPVEANPEAGSGVVLHKDSRWKEAWDKFKDSNPVVQGKNSRCLF